VKRPLPLVQATAQDPAPAHTSGPGRFSRRSFVDWLLGTSIGGLALAVAYPVSRYLVPPEIPESAVGSVTLGVRPTDVPANTGQVFKFGTRPGILIRTPAGELRAFSARCTHLDCTVQYRDDVSHIWCACHNGHYDLNGRNIAGPPPRPLEAYDVNTRGDQIVVSRRA
jgi:Rieske Fe-S protein